MTLDHVVLFGNSADRGGGLFTRCDNLSITSSTISHNSALTGGAGIYYDRGANPPVMHETIVAHSAGSSAVYWSGVGATPEFHCSDFYTVHQDNFGGLLSDIVGTNGNISGNPLFCGSSGGDEFSFELRAGSPCLPENNGCGLLMGAYGEGCVVTDIASGSSSFEGIGTVATPNPFTVSTEITAAIPVHSPVTMRIYDLNGRLVRRLDRAAQYQADEVRVIWDGHDDRGNSLPSGVYFCKVEARQHKHTQRLILLR